MSKHTPGPWVCYADLPSVEPNWHIVTTKSRMRVLANVHIEPGNEMDKANARLIAAAPDLLEALKAAAGTCQTFLDDCGDVRDFSTQADINDWQEIISKAEGLNEAGEQGTAKR